MRSPASALRSSPSLVGAITLLIACVGVYIAYNANAGLPFVPTYDLRAELPNGAKLVEGNDVRLGGFRIGVIEEITAKPPRPGGGPEAIAEVTMKLDKKVQPLPADTSVVVRARSALGLKYIELIPGQSRRTLVAGDTIRVGGGAVGAQPPEDLEDLLATFEPKTRDASRAALEGFGNALSGRGPALNEAIGELRPLLRHLQPVMENLSDPDTELENLIRALGAAAGEAAPVARVQAELFTNMADTFAALGRNPAALQDTISEGPPTLEAGIRSFRVQTPFLADLTVLSRRLRPAAAELEPSLPPLSSALRAGVPVLGRSVALSGRLGRVFAELEDLGENPNTLLALRDLDTAIDVSRPGVEFIAPFQTVCNFAVYFLNPLGEHMSAPAGAGNGERILLKQANRSQENSLTTQISSRPVDVPAGQDPQADSGTGDPPAALHTQYGNPAIGPDGKADCGAGQTGYPDLFAPGNRYPPSADPREGGGSHVVLQGDLPGSRGGTYKARELGIDDLGDVP